MTRTASTTPRHGLALALGAMALILGTNAVAAPPINTLKNSFFGGRTDTAIDGYDTVAYFTENRAVKGSDQFVTEWKGAKWKFTKAEHLASFKAAPEKYAPQYGGYCAYGVAVDNLVKIDPDQFAIVDGKLYLNYDAGVQDKWKTDIQGYIKAANAKFDALLKQ
jgi:hypothetical protein